VLELAGSTLDLKLSGATLPAGVRMVTWVDKEGGSEPLSKKGSENLDRETVGWDIRKSLVEEVNLGVGGLVARPDAPTHPEFQVRKDWKGEVKLKLKHSLVLPCTETGCPPPGTSKDGRCTAKHAPKKVKRSPGARGGGGGGGGGLSWSHRSNASVHPVPAAVPEVERLKQKYVELEKKCLELGKTNVQLEERIAKLEAFVSYPHGDAGNESTAAGKRCRTDGV
jgi:hypothetical protein